MRRHKRGFITGVILSFLVALWVNGRGTPIAAFFPPQESILATPTVAETAETAKQESADKLLQQAQEKIGASKYEAAIELLRSALKVYRELGDRAGEASTLSNLGWAHYYLGHYQTGMEFHRAALTLQTETEDPNGEAYSLYALGWAFFSLGEYDRAIAEYEKALKIFQDIEGATGSAFCLGGMGWASYYLGKNLDAISFHHQALDIRKTLDYPAGVAFSLGGLGVSYSALGLSNRALELHQEQLEIARQIGNRREEAYALSDIGKAYTDLNRYRDALDAYQQALEIQRDIGDRWGEKITLSHMGETLLKSGNKERAIENLFAAIEVLESLKPGLSDANKVSLFDSQTETYRLLQQILIEEQNIEFALEIAERSRARAFVELLASRLAANPEEFQPPDPLSIKKIKQIAAQQNATLVEYAIGENQLWCWVIPPNGKIAFRTITMEGLELDLEDAASRTRIAAATGRSRGVNPSQAALSEWVGNTRDEVKDGSGNSEKPLGRSKNARLQQSYQLLIEPIVDLLPENPEARVIFIPQGSLFLVPFPALQDEAGRYLIEQHTILTAPSIQVLDLTHKVARELTREKGENPLKSASVLVVGNPKMPSIPINLGEQPTPLSPLPGAEEEAIAISSLLDIAPIIGETATESAIAQQMSGADIIHLATHGLLDELKHLGLGVPGALALTPDPQEDGLLTSDEILSMNLNASLVVLSACNTGRGKITGDGVIGLSRSFISAGVPSVVVSLWFVPDAPTADLMRAFYRVLQDTPDKASALRSAMLDTMQQHPDPRDWAAFTLVGEAF
ncbi:CHAT domain-containing protein [Phormidium sp. CCY1219]|uniref:CHAT domain-containing protein n=1 Tax=Phormidium sp. CCY1219 TaxID=2886104 RepID=UPI002D1F12F6|nr:CHAT domain-containing tetratricopeptide repeat protein [Phormidium sp. CCY1219]MEB3828797.1 CHAT domain-containing protein [Phormidium sp. CCY1219]